ncbi:MAG: ARMT1-like domain-containing protein [Candidatus Micrarchaeia archaeon]
MKADKRCKECLLRVFEGEVELAGIREKEKVIEELEECMERNFSLQKDPYSQLATEMERIVKKASGGKDFFRELKGEVNEKAREICGKLKVNGLNDAMKVALAGNSLDLLHLPKEEALPTAMKALREPIKVDERRKAVARINKADEVIYVADNAGEVFFDRFLVEELYKKGKRVRYVVRKFPMSNDAIEEDAREAGIHRFAKIEKFDGYGYEAEEGHPLIISKGHAGWVTLSEGNPRNIIFIVKVKRCGIIASSLGVKPGDGVIKVV